MTVKTRTEKQSYEAWLQERMGYIGCSEGADVLSAGRYGCATKLFNRLTGVPKDFDDGEKAEFRRGRRLEGAAASYYAEVTGRAVYVTTITRVPGKPHLALNADRLVFKELDKEEKSPGYLELKVVGRFSMAKIKKEGLIDDYIIQLQQGCAIGGYSWGAYGIYCPETDELLHWDVDANEALGQMALERTDDFWHLNVQCGIPPEKFPEPMPACGGCAYKFSCWSGINVKEALAGVIKRPDLESWAEKFAEIKGMGSETEQAEEALKAEFMNAVGGVPGLYHCGRFEVPFTITKQKRFSGELAKKKNPSFYEECRVESEVKTIRKPKEL